MTNFSTRFIILWRYFYVRIQFMHIFISLVSVYVYYVSLTFDMSCFSLDMSSRHSYTGSDGIIMSVLFRVNESDCSILGSYKPKLKSGFSQTHEN